LVWDPGAGGLKKSGHSRLLLIIVFPFPPSPAELLTNFLSTLLTLLSAQFYSSALLSKYAAGPAAYLLSMLLEGSKAFLFAGYLKSKLLGQQRT